MSTICPAGVATALPSSHPPNLPASHCLLLASRLLQVQLSASSRSASTAADIINARNGSPQRWMSTVSSIARHSRPLWISTGTGGAMEGAREKQPGLFVLRLGPGFTAIGRTADDRIVVTRQSSHNVEVAAVDEQRRPKLTVNRT